MLSKPILCLLLFQVFSLVISGSTTSQFQVTFPPSLYKNNGYTHQNILFGTPKFGESTTGQLLYLSSSLCNDEEVNEVIENDKIPSHAFIVMVNCGACSFVSQIRNIQLLGASGALIVDNTCIHSSNDYESSILWQNKKSLMVSDASEIDVSIPSFLILKEDADIIKKENIHNPNIEVQMLWGLPSQNNAMGWSLWTSPKDVKSKELKNGFVNVIGDLDNTVHFTPHYYIYDGRINGCYQNQNKNCEKECTNNGRYCAIDFNPEQNSDSVLGSDIIIETLRQICIWEISGGNNAKRNDQKGIGLEWWWYTNNFTQICDTENKFTNTLCIQSIIKQVGLLPQDVEKCMENSGNVFEDRDNILLENELKKKINLNIIEIPSIDINGEIYTGTLTTSSILQMICSNYPFDKRPDICNNKNKLFRTFSEEVISTNSNSKEKKGLSIGAIISIIIGCICFFVLISYLYWQKTQNDMRKQVKDMLSDYIRLGDGDGYDEVDEGRGVMLKTFN